MSYRPYSGPTWPTAKRKSHNRKRGRGLKLTRTPEIHPSQTN